MFRADVLQAVLTPQLRQQGFCLEEEGRQFVNLLLEDKVVAVFPAKGITVAEILATAERIAKKTTE